MSKESGMPSQGKSTAQGRGCEEEVALKGEGCRKAGAVIGEE